MDPIIAASARRHYDRDGLDDDAILHAYAHPIGDPFVLGDDKVMLVGPDLAGRMLEIGAVATDEGDVIIHAMKARAQYLPKPPRRRDR